MWDLPIQLKIKESMQSYFKCNQTEDKDLSFLHHKQQEYSIQTDNILNQPQIRDKILIETPQGKLHNKPPSRHLPKRKMTSETIQVLING